MFKPKKNPRLNLVDDESSVDQDGIPRRPRKEKRESNKDEGLNIDERSDVSDSEDFGMYSRRMRSKNKSKMRKKGNLNLNDRSAFEDEPEAIRKAK